MGFQQSSEGEEPIEGFGGKAPIQSHGEGAYFRVGAGTNTEAMMNVDDGNKMQERSLEVC